MTTYVLYSPKLRLKQKAVKYFLCHYLPVSMKFSTFQCFPHYPYHYHCSLQPKNVWCVSKQKTFQNLNISKTRFSINSLFSFKEFFLKGYTQNCTSSQTQHRGSNLEEIWVKLTCLTWSLLERWKATRTARGDTNTGSNHF